MRRNESRFAVFPVALVLLITAITAVVAPSVALAQADFSEFCTFGDSLTDNEILAVINGKPVELYGADPMEALFVKGADAGDDLTDYAVAGSGSAGILGQIDFYEFLLGIGLQDTPTLFALEAGANDLLDNIDLLANHAPGTSDAADAVIDAIQQNLRQAFLRLRSSARGAEFIVWTLPDLSLTPRYFGVLTGQQIANLRAHVDRVNRKIRRGAERPRVAVLDIDASLAEVIANPPVLRGVPLVPPPAFCDFDHLFADDIHPTAVGNALLANDAAESVNAAFGDSIPPYTEDELADLARIP